ncbi:MAG: FAD-binding oxidoreductase [Clostridia bacterium]|nr:FAD-binding oxidoreductase [Clostridia bacterium]
MSELKEKLSKLISPENVSDNEALRAQKAVDLYALRMYQQNIGWKPTLPQLVVTPETTQQVADVLSYLNEENIKVVPRGGGSGVLAGAEVRDEEVVVLDVSKLTSIGEINDESLYITCGAGVYLKDLEKHLNERGYKTGHYPQSFDLAQMGGLVSTNSIGQFSSYYGGIENLLLGMKAVNVDGTIVEIKPNPRKATGPDLRHIYMGGEGAFGIVTEVTIKIFPMPEETWMQAYRVEDMDVGLEIIRKIIRDGAQPPVVRLHDWLECEKPYGQYMEEDECMLLFLTEGSTEKVAADRAIIEKYAGKEAIASAGEKPVEHWLIHRNDAEEEYEEYGKQGLLVDTIEISATWSDIHKIYNETVDKIYMDIPEILYASAHSSHSYMNGTNLYFMFGAMPGSDIDTAEKLHKAIWDVVMEVTVKYNGAIAHHHGIGKHRVPYLRNELGNGVEVLKAMKDALDPKHILNPGSLIAE